MRGQARAVCGRSI
jgi:Flp pilus assembly protein TadB